MPDNMSNTDARLDAALAAMRQPLPIDSEVVARVAARAVLANAPVVRTTTWWMRSAAAVTIVALGTLGVSASRGRTDVTTAGMPSDAARTAAGNGITLTPVLATSARAIVFELDAPGAHSVQVLGDFNQWSRDINMMQRGTDGRWRVTTLLPPGRYVYAYLVDGERFQRDPLRDAVEDRDFGVTGSELVVGEAP